jgi:hypothetical protein
MVILRRAERTGTGMKPDYENWIPNQKVGLTNTANGPFMNQKEAKRLMLESSTILYGIK